MDPARRKTIPWKVLRILAAALLLLVATSWIWLKSVESRQWSRMQQRVEELGRQAEARGGLRPVLRGTPEPGNAWDDYLEAFRIVKNLLDHEALATPALQLLARGTRRAEVRRVGLHEGTPLYDFNADSPALDSALRLCQLAIGRSLQLLDEGRSSDAAVLLLDLCQFGQDVMRDGSGRAGAQGCRIGKYSLQTLRYVLVSRRPPNSVLEQVDRELEKLDLSFPRQAPALLGDLERFGRSLLEPGPASRFSIPTYPTSLGDWRYCWSNRLKKAAAFMTADESISALLDVETKTAAEEYDRWIEFYSSNIRKQDNYVECYQQMMLSGWPEHRRLRAQLRLMRMAVHYLATRKIMGLDDPFGTTLLYLETSDGITVWSVGKNRKDARGKGDWPMADLDDIRIEVPRGP
jgi:hypothetical protein